MERFQGGGGRSERELTKGVWGAVRKLGHPWPSGGGVQVAIPLPSGSAWELGFPLQRGITEALAYLLLGPHSLSFLGFTCESFGNTVVLF